METLIIIAGGLIGGGSSFKKNFLSVWLWYINTIFALVPALWLTPQVSSMLDLGVLPSHLRTAAAFLALFIICLIVLFKISEQVLPKPEEVDKYPAFPGKVAGAICGFLTGCCYASILVYLAGSVPVLEGTIRTKSFKSAGAKTLCRIAYGAAFQPLPDEKTCLRSMNALESPRKDKKKESGEKESQEKKIRGDRNSSGNIQEAEQRSPEKRKKRKKKRKNTSQSIRKDTGAKDSVQPQLNAEAPSLKKPHVPEDPGHGTAQQQ